MTGRDEKLKKALKKYRGIKRAVILAGIYYTPEFTVASMVATLNTALGVETFTRKRVQNLLGALYAEGQSELPKFVGRTKGDELASTPFVYKHIVDLSVIDIGDFINFVTGVTSDVKLLVQTYPTLHEIFFPGTLPTLDWHKEVVMAGSQTKKVLAYILSGVSHNSVMAFAGLSEILAKADKGAIPLGTVSGVYSKATTSDLKYLLDIVTKKKNPHKRGTFRYLRYKYPEIPLTLDHANALFRSSGDPESIFNQYPLLKEEVLPIYEADKKAEAQRALVQDEIDARAEADPEVDEVDEVDTGATIEAGAEALTIPTPAALKTPPSPQDAPREPTIGEMAERAMVLGIPFTVSVGQPSTAGE